MTPMEKYDAENAKLNVVDVMPLMRILLVDVWDPSTTGEMLVLRWSVYGLSVVRVLRLAQGTQHGTAQYIVYIKC